MTTKKLFRKYNEKIFADFIETEEGKKYLADFHARTMAKMKAIIDETKEKEKPI